MAKKVGVAILGLGVVGGGTYQTLVEHHDFYLKTQKVDLTVEAVLDKAVARLDALGVPEELRFGKSCRRYRRRNHRRYRCSKGVRNRGASRW